MEDISTMHVSQPSGNAMLVRPMEASQLPKD